MDGNETWRRRARRIAGMVSFVLAGGCFWCLDAAYRQLRGVSDVVSGYTDGNVANPSYEQVCTGATGHVEAVEVFFDPERIPEQVILDVFFTIHDPTTLNRQGADIGTQYRSGMYYRDDHQRELFTAAIERAQSAWTDPIVTELKPLGEFYRAEEYHQDFFAKNPAQGYCQAVVSGKVAKVRQTYLSYLR